MTEELPALEQAAHDLVANPAREPTPLATIEARAATIRSADRRRQVLTAAAAVVVIVLGVTSLVAYQRNRDVDLQIAASEDVQPMRFRVTWDGGDDDTITRVGELVDARLQSLGGSGGPDVQMVGAPDDRSIDVTITPSLSLRELRLLLESPGRLSEANLGFTSGIHPCDVPGHLTFDVGWPDPAPSDQCWTGKQGVSDLSGRGTIDHPEGRRISAVEVVPDGEQASVAIGLDGAAANAPGTTWAELACPGMSCPALFLDDVPLSEPFGFPARPLEATRRTTGWTVGGLARGDAEILKAILAAGPPVDVPIHVELLDGPGTTAAPPVGTTPPSARPPASSEPPAPATTTSPTIAAPTGELREVTHDFWASGVGRGSDGALDEALGVLRRRIEHVGVEVKEISVGQPAPSGRWPVHLVLAGVDVDPDRLIQLVRGRGVLTVAGVRDSEPLRTHATPGCVAYAAERECLFLGDPSGSNASFGEASLVTADGGEFVRLPISSPPSDASVSDQWNTCRYRARRCAQGRLAVLLDGAVLHVQAMGSGESLPDSFLLLRPGDDHVGRLALEATLEEQLPEGFEIWYSPDPVGSPSGVLDVETTTTAPAPDQPVPTLPAGETTTTSGPP